VFQIAPGNVAASRAVRVDQNDDIVSLLDLPLQRLDIRIVILFG
jgi:hypothetical protein